MISSPFLPLKDEGLDQISEGLATLRNMAADINEVLLVV